MATIRTIGPTKVDFSPPLAPGATEPTFWKIADPQPQNFTFTVTAMPNHKDHVLSVDQTWVDKRFTTVDGRLTGNPTFHGLVKNVGDTEVRDCTVCVSVVEF